MWELILEWCAEIFGASVHSKLGQLVAWCLGLFVLGLVLSMRFAYAGWALPGGLLLIAWLSARKVVAARDEVWRAACASLDEGWRHPLASHPLHPDTPFRGRHLGPTEGSLIRLAEAVAAVRRGRYVEANEWVQQIQRDLLRPEEIQLLDAVRAMISLALSANALPPGSPDLDVSLGRTVVAEAWNDPPRLAAIQQAWDRAGVTGGPLAPLRGLVRIRLDAGRIELIETPEARELSDEARAVGDEDLASELDARSRPAAYR